MTDHIDTSDADMTRTEMTGADMRDALDDALGKV